MIWNFFIGLANVLMVLTSLFLICLVLIQRGKGGGLAGAFGGVGGSSAFGTKAGDVFTRVTIYTAIAWFLLAMLLVKSSNTGGTSAFSTGVATDADEEAAEKVDAKAKPKVRLGKDTGAAPSTGTTEPANPGVDPLLPGSSAKAPDANIGAPKSPAIPTPGQVPAPTPEKPATIPAAPATTPEKPAPAPAAPAPAPEKPAADGKKAP